MKMYPMNIKITEIKREFATEIVVDSELYNDNKIYRDKLKNDE